MSVQPTSTELVDLVKTEHRARPLRELLHEPPTVLIGVDDAAGDALEIVDVLTVFDLAVSTVFGAAVQLCDAAGRTGSALAQYGAPPSDLVREEKVAGRQLTELVTEGLEILQGIPVTKAGEIEKALGVGNVREFALYPPYRAALSLVNGLYFPENSTDYDPERPADLLPKSGEYPTERVQYSTLVMDEIPTGDGQLVDVVSQAFEPLDLATITQQDSGFKRVAFGALLTFTQSWFAQGVTLGQLLHSTALAPGESTRIAVVDWSRRSRAGETEVIDETDDLSNDTSHNRAISEVTSAVANEAQGGFSESNTNSSSTQVGVSASMEVSSPFGGLFGGVSGAMGTTVSKASSNAHADSYSSSWGHRDVASSMVQNVNDRTHQHAHSSRSRRASVVKEVSQSEHENLSTRVIANYNHMHALTVQYYEVVQIHRVETALAKVDKVIFIPVALTDFESVDVIRRFQAPLLQAALSPGIRDAIRNLDVVELAPPPKTHFSGLGGALSVYTRDAVLRAAPMRLLADVAAPAADAAAPAVEAPVVASPVRLGIRALIPIVEEVNDKLWSTDQVAQLSGLLSTQLLRADSASLFLPNDLYVEGGMIEAGGATLTLGFRTSAGGAADVTADHPVALNTLGAIQVSGSSSERDVTATVTLTMRRNGVRFPVTLPDVTIPKGNNRPIDVVVVKTGGINQNLKDHLKANRLYYSQAIFRSLTSAEIAILLSGHSVKVDGEEVPVSQVVDPVPVRYVGNYLAFRMSSGTDGDWLEWLKDRGIAVGEMKEDLVPLGTGGTFAEAVLGRSNCAEKLDITRFWNWQDSPIPLQPSDIAPLQAGSRATAEDVKPGQLSTPIVNITTPTSLPDPAGTAAVLAAIQNGAMFRDMSGLQGTIGLASAALQATSAGAAAAGQQAGTNMNSLLTANTERQRIAAEMITSLAKTAASMYTGVPMGGGGGGGGGGGHSQDGAKINYFDKTKGAGGADSANGANGSGGAATPADVSGSSSGGAATNGAAANGNGYSHNPAALAATWGENQAATSLLEKALDHIGTALGETSPDAPPLTKKAWPKLDGPTVLARVHDLSVDANLFNQGALGLCTAAAFYHHVIQRKPAEFESFGKALYGGGVGFLGKLKVAPGTDLKNADYAAIAAKTPNMPPQADWMVMSALRDSENWILDFEGSPDETISMATSMKELAGWYDDTGFYTGVSTSEKTDDAAIAALKKTNNNHLALWIKIALFGDPRDATHMITIEGPMTVNKAADKVEFDYWMWGQPVKTLKTTYTKFKANYLGSITASF